MFYRGFRSSCFFFYYSSNAFKALRVEVTSGERNRQRDFVASVSCNLFLQERGVLYKASAEDKCQLLVQILWPFQTHLSLRRGSFIVQISSFNVLRWKKIFDICLQPGEFRPQKQTYLVSHYLLFYVKIFFKSH